MLRLGSFRTDWRSARTGARLFHRICARVAAAAVLHLDRAMYREESMENTMQHFGALPELSPAGLEDTLSDIVRAWIACLPACAIHRPIYHLRQSLPKTEIIYPRLHRLSKAPAGSC